MAEVTVEHWAEISVSTYFRAMDSEERIEMLSLITDTTTSVSSIVQEFVDHLLWQHRVNGLYPTVEEALNELTQRLRNEES